MVWHQEKPHHSATGLQQVGIFGAGPQGASWFHGLEDPRFGAGTLRPQLHCFCCLPVAGTPQGAWKGSLDKIYNELQVISINNSQLLLWERRWPEGYYVFIIAWIHLALQMLI